METRLIMSFNHLHLKCWFFVCSSKMQEGHPLDTACYKLTGSRLAYGAMANKSLVFLAHSEVLTMVVASKVLTEKVTLGYYMFALAREMNSAPSLLHWLWNDWRILLTCAFGASLEFWAAEF